MTKKRSKGTVLGDFWGKASLNGDEDLKDPWRVGRKPWSGKGSRRGRKK